MLRLPTSSPLCVMPMHDLWSRHMSTRTCTRVADASSVSAAACMGVQQSGLRVGVRGGVQLGVLMKRGARTSGLSDSDELTSRRCGLEWMLCLTTECTDQVGMDAVSYSKRADGRRPRSGYGCCCFR